MGKVQDTISKIGGHTGLGRRCIDVALQVPEQRPATAGSFPTDVRAVSRYLSEFNSTTTEPATTELIRALQHSNRLVNTPSSRLKIARLFEPIVFAALADLNTGYTGVDLPYPARSASDFEQATTLSQEMAACYKVILLDVLRRRGHLGRKHRLPVIYQAMKHLLECGLRFSQSYQRWPEKTWRDLNTLYLCAEREQGVDIVVHSSEKPSTIRQLYIQCCTFSVCARAHLPALYLPHLYHLLGVHGDRVTLTDKRPQPDNDLLYSVALDSAHAPCIARYSRYQPGQSVRFFNMDGVLDLLPVSETVDDEESLAYSTTTSSTRSTVTTSAETELDYTFIGQLRNEVGGNAGRQHARSARQTMLHAEAGLKEIHASMCSVSRHDATTGNSARPYDARYGAQWIVENRSQGGLGLKWTGKGNCRVNIGELVAHCEHSAQDGDSNWYVGIVRWIQTNGDAELHCGVETLACHASAVATSRAASGSANKSTYSLSDRRRSKANDHSDSTPSGTTEALLLNDHVAARLPPMLLVQKSLFRIGEKIAIEFEENRRFVKLVENYPVGGNFQCFGFQSTVA